MIKVNPPALEMNRDVILEFARYFMVSLIALACDFAVFLYLSGFIYYVFAAVIGFLAGAVAHYYLSIFLVFRRRKIKENKLVESVLFIGAGAAGLVVNVGVIAMCAELLLTSLPFAKFIAAGFTFLFGYSVRKLILF